MNLPLHAAWFVGVVSVFTGSSPAQSLWLVDSLQRPGSHFADLPAAVVAAAPGDLILVRNPLSGGLNAPPYTAAAINRPLTIVGEQVGGSLPVVIGAMQVTGIAAGQRATIASLNLSPQGQAPYLSSALQVANNPGCLVFANIRLELPSSIWSPAVPSATVDFTDCADVVLHDCVFNVGPAGNRVVRTRLWAEDSRFTAFGMRFVLSSGSTTVGGPGVDLVGSEVVLNRSTARASAGSSSICNYGGCTSTNWIGGTAVVLDATSRLVIGPGSYLDGPQHYSSWFGGSSTNYSAAVIGSGVAVKDPASTVLGAIQVLHTIGRVHQTSLDLTRLGQVAAVRTATEPGAFVLAAAGYRSSAPFATPSGPLWIDPNGVILLGILAANATGVATFPLPMTTSVPFGAHVAVQSAVLLPNATMTLSSPAFTTNLPPIQ